MVDKMESEILVSVIIPVWNDKDKICKCIQALESQSLSRASYEIIVVDNGSTDGTYEYLENKKTITLTQEKQPGSYAARNKGISLAKGKFLAFTDSDCIPSFYWLEELVKAIDSDQTIGIVAGHVEFFQDNSQLGHGAAFYYEQRFSMNQAEYAKNGACVTANWCSPSFLIKELGLFNSALKSGGDHELAKRIVSKDFSIKYSKKAEVLHPVRNEAEIIGKSKRVIGGAWDKSKSNFKFVSLAYGETKRTVKKLVWASKLKKTTLNQKLNLYSLILRIFLCTLNELIKLTLGKQSARS